MSGIQRRTVYYEKDDRHVAGGVFRFHDWNTVVTGLGTMMEPSQMVPRPVGGGQLDWEDEAIKTDIMSNINGDKPYLLSDDGPLVGYNLMPRSGR